MLHADAVKFGAGAKVRVLKKVCFVLVLIELSSHLVSKTYLTISVAGQHVV